LDKAKFCPECGNQFFSGASDPAWIAAMQERIKDAKHNQTFSFFIFISGIILCGAGVIIYLNFVQDILFVVVAFVGILISIVGVIESLNFSKKAGNIINQLGKGQPKNK
jgi:uncharacterized membrane protein HdeD (DUF308 family)